MPPPSGLLADHIPAAVSPVDPPPEDDSQPAGAPPPGDQQEADMQEAAGEQLDSSQGGQLQKRVPQWRIIRPQRCKYRHMVADPYDEVEVGA